MLTMAKKMKVIYAAGPGNIIGTFNCWNKKQDDPSQVSITYSGQFFDVCSALDIEGYVISSNPEKSFLKQGSFTLEHRPILFSRQSGILYYLGQILYELSIVTSALKFKANVVVGNSTSCFFVLSLLPRLGIQVIPSLHCVLWSKYIPQSKIQKLLWSLNRNFFAKDCLEILSISEDINEQVRQVTHNQSRPIVNFLSTYRRTEFENVDSPSKDKSIFQVLFAGRIEVDKGVFDLLEIAKQFKLEGQDNIRFNICGTGSASESLVKQVEEFELQSSFILHGYCNKSEMQKMFSLSHIVIVPTKSDFVEGLNKVVIEGVLANRPVITSSVCPALFYVKEAVLEVPPDNIEAYANAILRLRDDGKFYDDKQKNCSKCQEIFYSASQGWGEKLRLILEKNKQF